MRPCIHNSHNRIMVEKSGYSGKSQSLCSNDDFACGDDIVSLSSFFVSDFFAHQVHTPRSFIRTLIDEVIHEYQFAVPKAYLILPSLKPILDNSTMIALIAMIYHVAKNRNQWVCGDPTGYLWWQRAHHLAVTTLTLFALADTALYIYAQVLLWGQIDVSQLNPKVLKAANSYGQVHITYTTLYLVVAIEILVWAICVAWKAWQQNLRSRVSHPSGARRKTPEQ